MAKNRSLTKVAKRQEQNTKSLTPSPGEVIITERVANVFGIGKRAANANNRERPYVSLKYFDGSYECFSDWSKPDLVAFTDLLRRLSQMSWSEILATGGKRGVKTGLGCTRLLCSQLPKSVTKDLSEDLAYMEMRVSIKARIHGFRMNEAFFLLCLDKDHKICS
ncbi:hypothetical protein ASY01nite_13880 [Acetobacter syzygii]|uniref:hypothetical protein n=1 Tax=Acetobacter syzygii TaxID=146476 RepID=UPI0005DF2C76|nr:hypothetical protein [Acetobacter syzygii]GAN72102.1 hypothetical protein Absy_030_010 [Acetobacter syzygii]GBR64901.1 hypothetical protein AA0483_1591 [Acetobacter syzygii NRIC 0483]GEL56322.1 hypothetical protein ASY01nite_13880 [Acetobacter syzygii]